MAIIAFTASLRPSGNGQPLPVVYEQEATCAMEVVIWDGMERDSRLALRASLDYQRP